MRVKHKITSRTGAVVSGEPESFMGAITWRVLWDDADREQRVPDDFLIVID